MKTTTNQGWTVSPTQHAICDTFGVKDGRGNWVAKVHPLNGTESDREEAKNRAHVLAAAPDLLTALERVTRSLRQHIEDEAAKANIRPEDVCPCWETDLAVADAALSKAKGADHETE